MDKKKIVILGATSAIAEAAARIWAPQGAAFSLVARDAEKLDVVAADLIARGASEARKIILDCATADAALELDTMVEALGGLDILLLAYGVLGDQVELEADPSEVTKLIQINFGSAVAWSMAASAILARQRSGTLLVIGSVAGDRGRKSNFVYGATKGGLGRLIEGISHKLTPLGARAVLIKPGFVNTPMTAGFTKKGLLWAKPEAVAAVIVKAGESGGPSRYAPGFWMIIMLIIRHIPSVIFNKLNI